MTPFQEEIYSFIVEWFDPEPQLVRKYLFRFHPENYVDMKEFNKGCFLKRTYAPNISRRNLIIGATIQLLSRDLKLVDYGDEFTRKSLEILMEKCILVLRTSTALCDHKFEDFIIAAEQQDLTISNVASSDTYVAIEFRGFDSTEKIRSSSNTFASRIEVVAFSETATEVEILKQKYFQKRMNKREISTQMLEDCTFCLIKPHIVRDYSVGSVLRELAFKHNCSYSNIQSFSLDRECASEFLEVYKETGLIFKEMVDELCSGTCIAFIVHKAVDEFRLVAGPFDVTVAKALNPESIRSKFGRNRAQNAIHCTDLSEEKEHEINYFFDILVESKKM